MLPTLPRNFFFFFFFFQSLNDNITYLFKNSWESAGLSDMPGLKLASNQESPIVFLILEKSTGSIQNDLQVFENIAERVSNLISSTIKLAAFHPIFWRFVCFQALNEYSVFVVTSKRSKFDKCRLPVGIRLMVSAGHSESDLLKAIEALKSVAAVVLKDHK